MNQTFVIATHNPALASIARQIYRLEEGQLVAITSADPSLP
jgi:ABC-type lipoprotein export system ATPase subunit